MRFQISVIDDLSNSGSPEEMAAVDEFNDHLEAHGHWIFACGLAAPSTSKVIDNRLDVNQIDEAPLLPAKEQFSGFWIIDAESNEEALSLALAGSKACNRKVELRPLLR